MQVQAVLADVQCSVAKQLLHAVQVPCRKEALSRPKPLLGRSNADPNWAARRPNRVVASGWILARAPPRTDPGLQD